MDHLGWVTALVGGVAGVLLVVMMIIIIIEIAQPPDSKQL